MSIETRNLIKLKEVLNPISLRSLLEDINKDREKPLCWLGAKKAIFNLLAIGKIRLENDYKISTTEKQDYDHENQTRFKNQLQS